jgi:hypothetical protein
MPKTETRTDKLQQAHERLSEAVESIVSGDDWKRMLETAAKFHKYSFDNQLLIFCQRPHATKVAGFNRWKSLGRLVRKGEKGIQILAPVVDRKKELEVRTSDLAVEVAAPEGDRPKTVLRGFRVVHVFDISQTDGEDLDLDLVRPELLNGAAPQGLCDSLVAQASDAGYTVIRTQRGSANGYCDFLSKEIGIDPDLPDLQAVKTLVHELGHALLHEGGAESRETAEIEVESAAYVVLDVLGLNSEVYSFPYIARWANGDLDLIRSTAERAVTCAKTILESFEDVDVFRMATAASSIQGFTNHSSEARS